MPDSFTECLDLPILSDLTNYQEATSAILKTLSDLFKIAIFDESEGVYWVCGHFLESLSFEGPDYGSEED